MKYAAYGSNLHPLRLQRRTGVATLLATAAIDNMAIRFHKRGNTDGSGKCNIIEQADASIHVAVFEIPRDGIEKLDVAEGVGSGYEKAMIAVPGFGECLTYIAQATHIDESLKPFEWYKDLVLAGCRFHQFPRHYIEAIEMQEAVADPDPERHAIHTQLLEYG